MVVVGSGAAVHINSVLVMSRQAAGRRRQGSTRKEKASYAGTTACHVPTGLSALKRTKERARGARERGKSTKTAMKMTMQCCFHRNFMIEWIPAGGESNVYEQNGRADD